MVQKENKGTNKPTNENRPSIKMSRYEIICSLVDNLLSGDNDDSETVKIVENMLTGRATLYTEWDNEALIAEYREVFEECRDIIIV